jgi:hypothetical protein
MEMMVSNLNDRILKSIQQGFGIEEKSLEVVIP